MTSYDPQYETNVPHFNKRIVESWIKNNDNFKVKHWLEHGRPHNRIANDAVFYCCHFDNLDALKLIYECGWLKKLNILKNVLSTYEDVLERDNIYHWMIDEIFNDKEKSIKSKRKFFLYQLFKTPVGHDLAMGKGVDFKIKEAQDDLNFDLLVNSLSWLNQYKLHGREENLVRAYNALNNAITYISNGTPLDVSYLIKLSKYVKYNEIREFFVKLTEINRLFFTENVLSAMFLTELQSWKRYGYFDEALILSLVKLFKRSEVSAVIVLTENDFNDVRSIKEYFKDRRYRVGSVIIVGCEYNTRVDDLPLRTELGGKVKPVIIEIDIRDYVFIEQNAKNANKPVSDKEKEESRKKYEAL